MFYERGITKKKKKESDDNKNDIFKLKRKMEVKIVKEQKKMRDKKRTKKISKQTK